MLHLGTVQQYSEKVPTTVLKEYVVSVTFGFNGGKVVLHTYV